MNFIGDLREIAESFLDSFSVTYDKALSAEEIIKIYVNVQNRLIKPQPRKVLRSTELSNSTLDNHTNKVLDEIERKSQNGENLNPYLSKGLLKGSYTDKLFSDWSIYHFHLGLEPKSKDDYFVERSSLLLFTWITNDTIYYIDIRPHGKYVFAQLDILNTVHDEWPILLEPYRLKGIAKIEIAITTNEDIMKYREGVIVAYKLGNDYYAVIGGGITTAKTSAHVTMQTDELIYMARKAQKCMEKNIGKVDAYLSKHPHYDKKNANFKLVVLNNDLYILETNSKIYFSLECD